MEKEQRERLEKVLKELAELCHRLAKEKGWWDKPRTFGDLIALCHSELSEALEEYRSGVQVDQVYLSQDGKPEGIPMEFADLIIRLMDFCGAYGINIGAAVCEKLEYNRSRPYRHGGKRV